MGGNLFSDSVRDDESEKEKDEIVVMKCRNKDKRTEYELCSPAAYKQSLSRSFRGYQSDRDLNDQVMGISSGTASTVISIRENNELDSL